MALTRYLLYISYIGTPFRGAQRQVIGVSPRLDDPSTIQGRLEMALKELNPCNDPIVFLSSRTDAGVHALSATAHVDLYRRNSMIYEPRSVTVCLNKYFVKEVVPIRVLKTYMVPNDFSSRRNAVSRLYLYRLAVVKANEDALARQLCHFPIEELNRCHFICNDRFNIEAMRNTAKLFEGLHDFRSFMGKESKDPDRITRKRVLKLEILDSTPHLYSSYSLPECTNLTKDAYKYYDIYFESQGFLYKQVSGKFIPIQLT